MRRNRYSKEGCRLDDFCVDGPELGGYGLPPFKVGNRGIIPETSQAKLVSPPAPAPKHVRMISAHASLDELLNHKSSMYSKSPPIYNGFSLRSNRPLPTFVPYANSTPIVLSIFEEISEYIRGDFSSDTIAPKDIYVCHHQRHLKVGYSHWAIQRRCQWDNSHNKPYTFAFPPIGVPSLLRTTTSLT
ncbi:hypothetical protein K458DRAFT_39357 [Lentithecium fluviatile CBS 122367]|uniref:Uncharacterized protein n=1 Tax=Lentithecium fluviatile CBS 122367 TaxID=1168545 RepID=A0A6G1J025_9PLEO|nr:hypothetical protein K458DRAFT_39357 [Lentithecium fluviatile CBS 122367]